MRGDIVSIQSSSDGRIMRRTWNTLDGSWLSFSCDGNRPINLDQIGWLEFVAEDF